MGMGGGTSGKFSLGTILLNEAKDFALGAAYEQVCSTIGFYGRNIANRLEDNMTYKSIASATGFTAGLFLDAALVHQAMEGNTLAKYFAIGKAVSAGTSLVYNQAKKITKRLQK